MDGRNIPEAVIGVSKGDNVPSLLADVRNCEYSDREFQRSAALRTSEAMHFDGRLNTLEANLPMR